MSADTGAWIDGRVPPRGRLLVFEGGDGAGKSTQAARLAAALETRGRDVLSLAFPARGTAVGVLLNAYLRGERVLQPRVAHLLFAANRWELADRIRDALDAGTDVVLDRYWYSGAAYTMALECGADADWCAAPERGLPRADVVFYLECDTAVALARGKGAERYERVAFQDKVAAAFETLVARAPATAQRIDASAPADAVHAAVLRALDQ